VPLPGYPQSLVFNNANIITFFETTAIEGEKIVL
jgi:hypothetical protein